MMYIGAVFGGPEGFRSKVAASIFKIKRLMGEQGEGTSGSLDIVFDVPGSITGPDYEGIRTGSLSRKMALLQVQIAVPSDLNGKEQVEIDRFIVNSLRHAARIARPVFERAKISYSQEQYDAIVHRIERALSPN